MNMPNTSASSDSGAHESEALYDIAGGLCDAGNFSEALPMALRLVLQAPGDPRFAFISATCLQRLKMHAPAASLFGMAAIGTGALPAAAYRMGECLVALGQPDDARQAFSACQELCRSTDRGHDLMQACEQALEQLR